LVEVAATFASDAGCSPAAAWDAGLVEGSAYGGLGAAGEFGELSQ
jgi:hypothetical protein